MSTPNPGSDDAVDLGCRCPIHDNYDTAIGFWINPGCPVHGMAPVKKEVPDADGKQGTDPAA